MKAKEFLASISCDNPIWFIVQKIIPTINDGVELSDDQMKTVADLANAATDTFMMFPVGSPGRTHILKEETRRIAGFINGCK